MGQMIELTSLDGGDRVPAYRAEPVGTPRGGIVVIQEIFGINSGIRRKCDHYASLGYVVLAPELFCRFAPGVELDADKPDELERAFELMGLLDQDKAIEDIEAAIRYLRGAGAGKVGAVGYCLGGRLAYLVATRTDADAIVGYYAVGLDELLRESHAIGKPLLLHIAKEDRLVPPEQQAAVHAGLGGNRHVTLVDYPGVDHGFAAEEGARRSPAAAAQADARTEAFFAEHIG
jgi:carboxymethylenebutenolidase